MKAGLIQNSATHTNIYTEAGTKTSDHSENWTLRDVVIDISLHGKLTQSRER